MTEHKKDNLFEILSPHLRDISPVELKIFILLFYWSQNTKVSISTYDLAQKANIEWKEIEEGLEQLNKRGLVSCSLHNNPFQEIEVLLTASVDNS